VPEEQDLLKGIAEMLSLWLERKEAREALKAHSRSLEQAVQERTTELKNAQEELLRKERLAVLGQLAGGVGHELRAPLAVISNAVYYLQTKLTEADDDTRDYLEIIASEVGESEKIVSDLLDFSRTRSPDRRRVSIQDLAAGVLEKLPPVVDVAVVTEIPSGLPEVLADPGHLAQVLANIVSNAYQAMPNGGRLIVEAVTAEDAVCLSISDTGVGISKENRDRIFEPLFSTKPRGTGLGLAISRMLVQANDGTIDFESEEGVGSTFRLTLPVV
jgi:signal transduction histidine kinase